MDDDATQPSTQPFLDPRRTGRSGELSPEDGSDIVLRLHPTTPAAIEAVQSCAEYCSQHVFQNTGALTKAMNEQNGDLNMESQLLPGQDRNGKTQINYLSPGMSGEWDIALRLSSRVRNPNMGWVFGRDKNKCDILLQSPEDKRTVRISGMHFRIYISDDGIIMLEDMSTNGTSVDDVLLRRGNASPCRRALDNGYMISVIARTDRATQHVTRVNFMVRFPSRPGPVGQVYAEKLQNFINKKAGQIASRGSNILGFGGIRSSHGMLWDGGDKYGVIGVVGKGAFATVFKLVDKSAGTVYAAKEIDKIKFMKNGELDTKLGNELRIIKSLDHPHIVKYCDYQDEKDHLYIMMEYIGHGDMAKYMSLHGPVPELLTKSVARQLCQALKYIHDEGVTHRDIKPDNILIAKETPMVVKLTDFGLSKLAEGPDAAVMKTFCGTLLYCAPEVYPAFPRLRASGVAKRNHGSQVGENGERVNKAPSTYSRKVDIWSVAAVIFHMLTGDPPYIGTAENQGETMLRNILSHRLDLSPLANHKCSTDCASFIESLMKVDPAHRLTAASSLKHPWLNDVEDVEDIPPCRSEIEENLRDAVKQADLQDDYESDYDGTGFSSRVAELDSQNPTGQPVDINKELSDDDLPFDTRATRPQPPLFGEIRATGLPDSGIFGSEQPPVISGFAGEPNRQRSDNQSEVASDPAIRTRPLSAQNQIEATSAFDTALPALANGQSQLNGHSNSINGRNEAQSNDGLQSTTSQLNNLDFEDDLEALIYENPASPASFASGFKRLRQSNEEEHKTSKRVTLLDRSHALPDDEIRAELIGVLSPTPGSIDSTPIEIRERLVMWGRAPRNTHQYKNPLDTRVPKLGMDLVFWRPNIDEDINNGMDWMEMSDIDALIFTRATHGIKVNGIQLHTGKKELLCGRLRTGDCIEIFSDPQTGEYLRFNCEFFHGNSMESRPEGEQFLVESNQELYEIATKSKSQDQ